ncbi:MAG: Uncharacterised protein [Halieaceae bacterium]|nr:MAG: Uncharacterised protein [Halieaceae bacterium]
MQHAAKDERRDGDRFLRRKTGEQVEIKLF